MASDQKKSPSTSSPQVMVLLDVHAILHRAYHALPEFASSRGESTGALYGLCTMLLKTIKDFQPDSIVACFDLPEPTYRHEAYEDYKAGRAKADEALVEQIKRTEDVFRAFGIPQYRQVGFEADDLLGTIVERCREREDISIIIASGDMDTLQLVDEQRVRVYTLKKGIKDTVLYDEAAVKERFGFPPERLPDFKGLAGDPSDNIIGIKGVGEKTASRLVQNFGSVENILEVAESTPEQLRSVGITDRMIEKLRTGRDEAIFSKILATIRRDAPIEWRLPDNERPDPEKVEELFNELEFRSLIPRAREVLGGLQTDSDTSAGDQSQAHHRQNDQVLTDQELAVVQVAAWLLDSNRTDPGLDDVLQVAGVQRSQEALTTLEDKLQAEGMWQLFNEIERPLIPVVEKMEKRGVLINQTKLKRLTKKYTEKLSVLERQIWHSAGGEFNINSPKQLGQVLFEDLKLKAPNLKKTPGGAPSTRESELLKLRQAHPVVELVLQHRELSKLIHTYLEPIAEMTDRKHRLHARFIQTGTTTGRMASTRPNLQNIPVRTEQGRNIREVFISSPGYTLVACDYSQIELRVAALLSGDQRLLEIFQSEGDVHKGVAAHVFEVQPEEVDQEMRRQAKVINFGILYGMGVNALKDNLGTDQTEARQFLETYFERFPELADYLDRVKKQAATDGYTTTLFGRRRYFSGLQSGQPHIRAAAERMAVNAPIQGTAADIIKKAMVEVDGYLTHTESDPTAHLLLQVHDELIYEVKDESLTQTADKIRSIMEAGTPKEVLEQIAFPVKVEVGKNWKDLKLLE